MDGEVTADVMSVARKLDLGVEPAAVAELLHRVREQWIRSSFLRLGVLVKTQRMLEK